MAEQQMIDIERWVTGGDNPCPKCLALNGQEFERGKGPQPVRDTHANCHCKREYVRSVLGPRDTSLG